MAKLFLIQRPAHSVGYRLDFVINEVCSGIVFIDYEAHEKVPFSTITFDCLTRSSFSLLFYFIYITCVHII